MPGCFSQNHIGLRDTSVIQEHYSPVECRSQDTEEFIEFGGSIIVQCGDCKNIDLLPKDITEANKEFRWELHRIFCVKRTTRYASSFTSRDVLISLHVADPAGLPETLKRSMHRARYLHRVYTSHQLALFSPEIPTFGAENAASFMSSRKELHRLSELQVGQCTR